MTRATYEQGDALDFLRGFPDGAVNLVLTDPPYSARTHKGARSLRAPDAPGESASRLTAGIAFDATDLDALRGMFAECARVTTGWVVSFLDYAHAVALEQHPPPGLRVLRIGVWVKTNPMPQLSGDRPAQGWEALVYMHRDDVRPTWNGGGKHGNFVAPIMQGTGHPTAKPLSILETIIERFTSPGDLVIDPFMGSGSTLVAAQNTGRDAHGVDLNPEYVALAHERLAQQPLFT